MTTPKYALMEIEAKMLVDGTRLPDLSALPCTRIDDRYLTGGRLRLRAITDFATGAVEYKLGKKYGGDSPYAQPIVNVYLSADEYAALAVLPGRTLRKRRYRYEHEGQRFSLDVFEGARAGLVLCEAEAPSLETLRALVFPEFVLRDVTAEPEYNGWNLAETESA
jgi:CYTH domain-containing protein